MNGPASISDTIGEARAGIAERLGLRLELAGRDALSSGRDGLLGRTRTVMMDADRFLRCGSVVDVEAHLYERLVVAESRYIDAELEALISG